MHSFNFDLENHAYAQKVINESSASGACLFLFNKLYQDERAISFIYHRKTPEAAIDIYRKSLFLVDANLPHLSPGHRNRDQYLATQNKKTYFKREDEEELAKNSKLYWQALSKHGYEQTAAMVKSISRNIYAVIGVHSENPRKKLVIDRALTTLEQWIDDCCEYVVEQSVQNSQLNVVTTETTVDLEKFSDRLSNREFQVVCEVMKGKSNKEIASTLFLSDYTVDNHLRRIYKKFGVHNRTALTAVVTSMN